jgi:hypothetical protein
MDMLAQCNEDVTVERQDGSRYEKVRALVTGNMILVPDAKVPIAGGDAILRKLPSGIVERLIVTSPGFYAKVHGFPDHYQVKYRHAGQGSPTTPGFIFHVSGNNARVNINSTDNSHNAVEFSVENMPDLVAELPALLKALKEDAQGAEQYVAMAAIASVEDAAKNQDKAKMKSALDTLGAGGKWVLDTATKIGAPVATALLKSYLGLPPG